MAEIRSITAVGAARLQGLYNMAQPELHTALGFVFPHNHPIPKESWTADAVLDWSATTRSMKETLTVGWYSLRSQPACRAVTVINQLLKSQCQYRNYDRNCKAWRSPNCPILPNIYIYLLVS